MKRHGLAIAAALACIAAAGCSGDNKSPTGPTAITGSGNIVGEQRTAGPVNSVELRIAGTVNLIPGGTQAITVRADDNVLVAIGTRDSSGVLIVEIKAGYSVSGYTLAVDVTLPDIESVVMRSAGTIAGSGFVVDALEAVLAGAGTINLDLAADAVTTVVSGVGTVILSGSTDAQTVIVTGAGRVRAFGMVSGSTEVVHGGAGPVEVTATTALDVVISGVGSVYYRGSPAISSVITGTGTLIDAN